LLAGDSIEFVYNQIKFSKEPVYLCNYIYSDSKHSKLAKKSVFNELDTNILPKRILLQNYVWAAGFIGCCLINTNKWLSSNYKIFSGTYYSHVGGILNILNQNIPIIRKICIKNRAEDVDTFTWSGSTFDVYFSFYDVINKSSLSHEDKEHAKLGAQRLFKVNNLLWLIAKRADDVYNFYIYKKFYSHENLPRRFIYFVIAFLPKFIILPFRRLHLKSKFR